MVLQPTTDNIAMRTKPVIAPETQIKRLPVSEKLVVIEPPAQAMPKIGVQGQWTQVRDSSGQEGFVAAWYVQVVSVPSTAAPAAAPVTPPGAALRVRTSVEGVALRSQPLVADSTLIRRMALGTELTVTDPAGASKIGVADQWLKVCDPLGTEGFVAAWFVSR